MTQPVAIVGIGGVFPGASDLDRYWENVLAGRDACREVPPGRWAVAPEKVFRPGPPTADRVYSKKGCFIEGFRLDPAGLNLDPEWLAGLDPMLHLLLHAGRQAFQSGRTGNTNLGRVRVILGNIALPTDKSTALALDMLGPAFEEKVIGRVMAEHWGRTAAINRYVTGLPAGLLAQALGLGGGAFTLDAACASSLYALKLAVDELAAGRCDAALAGGISRPDCLYTQMGFSQLRALSPSGRCAPFDARSDGLVVGEGAGIILLKRLDDALKDGDKIWAVIRGIGLSNDVEGNLLAPHAEGQVRAMEAAYHRAGWKPWDVDLIECHATGTPVGDAAEIAAMSRLWRDAPAQAGPCYLGAAKANVGHLLTGAGAAGMIKTLLSMQHVTIPPVANFQTARTELGFDRSPFRVPESAHPWRENKGRPRRAAVSAFGFGGINAHVLLEEYNAIPVEVDKIYSVPADVRPPAVAIVGLDATFGPWQGVDSFKERVLGGGENCAATADRGWRGVPETTWFKKNGPQSDLKGWYIRSVDAPMGRYRIPPRELERMLPQQVLMLETAAAALSDAGYTDDLGLRTGVFIGICLDLNTTNYRFRWSMPDWAAAWAKSFYPGTPPEDFETWVQELRRVWGPALDADRTLGGLGAITASRIAREFKIGGPSHTVAGEEISGFRAFEVACRALQQGDIDLALAGAVDLAGDLRSLWGMHEDRPFAPEAGGPVPGEGAAAFALKRLDDAVRDGNKIFAVVRGLGSASGGGPELKGPSTAAYLKSIRRACRDAGLDDPDFDLIEVHGSGNLEDDRVEASALNEFLSQRDSLPTFVTGVKGDVGHTGAASAAASLAKAVLCLHHEIIPPFRNNFSEPAAGLIYLDAPQFWLRNRSDGPRRALVGAMSVDGNCGHVVLEGRQTGMEFLDSLELNQPLGLFSEGLFVIEGDDRAELLEGIARLKRQALANVGPVENFARQWLAKEGRRPEKALGLALIVRDVDDPQAILERASAIVSGNSPGGPEGRIFFTDAPLGGSGEIAFVFPGAGNQFPGMARDLSVWRPEIFRRLDAQNRQLFDQFQAGRFWLGIDLTPADDHRPVIVAQVAVGAAVSDAVRLFGVRPDAAIGYSLGESAALAALGAWTDRDEMLRRTMESSLFVSDLAGECRAAAATWDIAVGEKVDWTAGLVDASPERVREALMGLDRAYLLIVDTPGECLVGGQKNRIARLVERLKCRFIPLPNVSTVHCEITDRVRRAYREMHLFETSAPEGVRFYSGASGRSYAVNRESAAETLLAQVTRTVDFPRLIEKAYADGVRFFLEMGPGASCTRMIRTILQDRPHLAVSALPQDQGAPSAILGLLGRLIAHRVPVDLSALYPAGRESRVETGPRVIIPTDGPEFDPPSPPVRRMVKDTVSPAPEKISGASAPTPAGLTPIIRSMAASDQARISAHEAFLSLSGEVERSLAELIQFQMRLVEAAARGGLRLPPAEIMRQTPLPQRKIAFDRQMCLEFAIGSIGKMLGPAFAEVDTFPTRVRLPDEPLMLVDRIVEIEGEPLSMTRGRVVTEHDVLPGTWYLDGDRIAACVAIEAGQADLFLSGYLGIDFRTRGLAVYRLLDAEVTFHRELPRPGDTISYDIRIDHFFKHGDTWLFRFNFDATVEGKPLMTMRNGCAGFFSQAELEAGRGLVRADTAAPANPGRLPEDWIELATVAVEAYGDEKISALRRGDLAGCFGEAFEGLDIRNPYTLPSGRMELIHRVESLDPRGGPYGLGSIRAEADVHPGDWYLICHFVDDRVMPGTLMYECCLHTLRVFLMRLGWVGEQGEVSAQPVPSVASSLKCRGQVIESTRLAAYEVFIKELGYGPEPYAIADAIMYADGRPIVEISDMSLRLSGLDKDKLIRLWKDRGARETRDKPPLFDRGKILAFAEGKPSDAFGEPYRRFDGGRFVARLPRPPYSFIDRVVEVQAEPFAMRPGGKARVEYDAPPEAWYFTEGRQGMPYAVLLETALQACGFMAAYMGSALTGENDLHFRNLGGSAVQLGEVSETTGRLFTEITCTKVSNSAGMILQNYDFEVYAKAGPIFRGDTYFGFFSPESLAQQKGMPEFPPYRPSSEEIGRGKSFDFPAGPPFPGPMLRMIDRIDLYIPDGGPRGSGFIRGSKQVRPNEWFFQAHFLQDPVWPGSLGLEALLQLLQVVAADRWHAGPDTRWRTPALHVPHTWVYRGQVTPRSELVTVEALVTEVDDDRRILTADGLLIVDGRTIYRMEGFGIALEA